VAVLLMLLHWHIRTSAMFLSFQPSILQVFQYTVSSPAFFSRNSGIPVLMRFKETTTPFLLNKEANITQ